MSTENIKAVVSVYDIGKKRLSQPKKGEKPTAVQVTFKVHGGGTQTYEYRDPRAIRAISRGGDPAAFRGVRIS